MTLAFLALASMTLGPITAHAWGKRGHQIVGDVAAILATETGGADAAFIRGHGFDLAYYGNVPDFVWKKPDTYQVEWTNHFMDLEIFARAVKSDADEDKQRWFEMDRRAFDSGFPDVKQEAGRSWWRIRELDTRLEKIAADLKALPADAPRAERHRLQEQWLVVAGTMGHYVGDMSQPLHCTENYDGQLTGQKGLHAFYEDKVVDALYPEIGVDALRIARRKSQAFAKAARSRSTLDLVRKLTEDSQAQLATVLKADLRVGRSDVRKASHAYKRGIAERLAAGALTLAEIWKRRTGWTYDGEKFYAFAGTPAYIYPDGAEPASGAPPKAAPPATK